MDLEELRTLYDKDRADVTYPDTRREVIDGTWCAHPDHRPAVG